LPVAVLVVIGCSAGEERGGQPVSDGEAGEDRWPRELLSARARVLDSRVNDGMVMPRGSAAPGISTARPGEHCVMSREFVFTF